MFMIASLAGKSAAKFVSKQKILEGLKSYTATSTQNNPIQVLPKDGVRYTVPQTIDFDGMEDTLIVRFRVADVYKNRFISVYYDDNRVQHKKKKVLAPGEMEQVVLLKSSFKGTAPKNITICTETE